MGSNSRRDFIKKTGIACLSTALANESLSFFTAEVLGPEPKLAPLKLWYQQPAREWMKALPIGNGRLGAVLFGGINEDRIALNEITMWAGQPDPNQELVCGKEKLAEIRQLFFKGDLVEGNKLAEKYLSGKPNTYGTHLPVGDLNLKFTHDLSKVIGYKRELDIRNAIHTVSYQLDEVAYKREFFCSNPHQALVVRLSADKKQSINVALSLNQLGDSEIIVEKEQLRFSGKAHSTLKVNGFPNFSDGGVDFTGIISVVLKGGTITKTGHSLRVEGADEVVILTDIRTSYQQPDYRRKCTETISRIRAVSYNVLKNAHLKDYRNLFERVELCLNPGTGVTLPTDQRLAAYNNGADDEGMSALFMQYSRYLLISSSRENSPLPANLQGLWNDNLAANMPWTCDYHLDINTQQNYWPANVTNLGECNIPLFNYIEYLSKHGAKTAEKVYGSPGWVAHTVTNVWGYTAPGEWPGWGLFPTASTWIALHLWEHYTYTLDQDFLAVKAYPLLKSNALFFLDYMVKDPISGYLLTGPCTSPENAFLHNGEQLPLSMMPTCDRVFVFELFTACVHASSILGKDETFRNSLKEAIAQLPPIKISRNGEIQEWLEDYPKAIPNHRHTTHLAGLYPFSQISLNKTPALADAAANTIKEKLGAANWEDVEWSRGNMINFYARLKQPVLALDSIKVMLKKFTGQNLLTFSVAGIAGANADIFVLDGNEAACAGIAEMLIQSHEEYVEFLPALPPNWKTGYFKGLCVRGGATASVYWKDMKIEKITFEALVSNSYHLKIPGIAAAVISKNGRSQSFQLSGTDNAFFRLAKNDRLDISF
jgi:alpha-L-fucosidase 2